MSDDEEIIYKGKSVGLYNYLADLGYGDFETFESQNFTKRERFLLKTDNITEKFKENVQNAVSTPKPLSITDHDYRKLSTILNSQLMFKEDANLVEPLLLNKDVCTRRPHYVFHTSVVLTGLLSSVVLLRSKVILGLVPAGLTAMCSCYSAWKFYEEFVENRKDYILTTHINDLKNLCFNILKIIRFIKETEILSTGQVSADDISSVSYVPPSKQKIADVGLDLDVLPQWKTLPYLRICLSDSVEEVLNLLTISVNSLRQSFFDNKLVEDHLTEMNSYNFNLCHSSEKGCSVTIVDIKELTSKYLSVQSEYLKELALMFSYSFLKDSISESQTTKFAGDKVFGMFTSLHKTLTDISFKLMMQYNTHNTASTCRKGSYKPSSRSHKREINELQNGVHNIFLLLYSALLRVRNLEDTLENLPDVGESQNMKDKLKLGQDVTEQLNVLRDDLISTVRCYDVLCQQAVTSKNVETTKQDAENGCNVIEVNIKETGIVVGTSDFTVNSPDEVFLSLSGFTNNEDSSNVECVDDWSMERKPQIPKSLLTELSQTLKSRKTNFIEREKHALKRKGLEDIDNLSPASDEESEESDNSFSRPQDRSNRSMKYKRHLAVSQDYSNSSDSDDEMDPFESGSFLTKLKIDKKYHLEPYSDSDSSALDVVNKQTICEREVECSSNLSTFSLANLAALKSQMWGANKEEHFSDGSES